MPQPSNLLSCEICGEPATQWARRDPFGKSDAKVSYCGKHGLQFRVLNQPKLEARQTASNDQRLDLDYLRKILENNSDRAGDIVFDAKALMEYAENPKLNGMILGIQTVAEQLVVSMNTLSQLVKAASTHETKPQASWRHKKTGNLYEVLSEGVDATNARNGLHVIVYRPAGAANVYVRDAKEFAEKFECIAEKATVSHELPCVCGVWKFDNRTNATLAQIGETVHRLTGPCYQLTPIPGQVSIDQEWEKAKQAMTGESSENGKPQS